MVADCPDCEGTGRVFEGSKAYVEGVAANLIVPIDASYREALLEWVRRAMAAEVADRRAMGDLGDYPNGWLRGDDLPDDDHTALARAVARDLGIERDVAMAICEAAGWPDGEARP